jgi:hypothetical protein
MGILGGRTFLVVGLALFYALFLVWYGGKTAPLTPSEADALVAVIERNAAARGGADPVLLESLRRVAASDDGYEFCMVNLIRHRQKAFYPEGSGYDDDVQAAERRYAAGMLPRLLKRAAFPVFLGTPTGLFLQPEGADVWDQVALVRYRSRRDFLQMVAEPGMRELGVHKWASVEKTQVFPVRAVVSFVWIRSAVLVLFVGIGVVLDRVLRRFARYRSK